MRGNKATLVLGFGLVAGALIACQAELGTEVAEQSGESALSIPVDAAPAPVEAAAPDAGKPPRPPPPEICKEAPENNKPPKVCLDYCLDALKDNKVYACVTALLGTVGPTGTPSTAQMAACGCTSLGEGNGTGVGRRTLYRCGGDPPFDVSVVPGTGTAGIIARDGEKFPSCMFDVTGGPPPVVVYDPSDGNACLKCHDVGSPFLKPRIKTALPAPLP